MKDQGEDRIEEQLVGSSSSPSSPCPPPSSSSSTPIPSLPTDVWGLVADYLPDNDLFALAMTCKELRGSRHVRYSHLRTTLPPIEIICGLDYEEHEDDGRQEENLCCRKTHGWLNWVNALVSELEDPCPIRTRLAYLAAYNGHLLLLRWLVRHLSPRKEEKEVKEDLGRFAAAAVKGGSMKVLKWAKEKGCPIEKDEDVCSLAARGGHLGILQWLRSQGCKWDWEDMCSEAAASGNLELLVWLRRKGCKCGAMTYSYAAAKGHLHIIKWLRRQGTPWNSFTCSWAAYGGHKEIIRWARSHDCPWDERSCSYAAQRGRLPLIKWLRSEGCPWNHYTCSQAAEGGHLQVLRWARSKGCPWNEETCVRASVGGHLEVLKWARSQGCRWFFNEVLLFAVEKAKTSQRHAEVVSWLNTQRSPESLTDEEQAELTLARFTLTENGWTSGRQFNLSMASRRRAAGREGLS